MIKALIIDDEESGCEVLEELIQMEHPTLELLDSVQTADDAVAAIKEHQPALIFLDIKLNGRSGFEVLERTAEVNCEVIFVTAYSEFALKAIKASALDYLLKPVSRIELTQAIEKAKSRLEKREAKPLGTKPKVNHFKEEKLILPTREGYALHPLNKVLYLVADRNYTRVYFKNGDHKLTTSTLGSYEPQLSGTGFFRIHKSYLVNINAISLYSPGNGGQVTMADGRRFEVSRRKKKELLELIQIGTAPETAG